MKKTYIFFTCALMIVYLYSTWSHWTFGTITYGQESFKNIKNAGATIFNGTHVAELTKINGCFRANEATLNELQVNGATRLKDCTVKGKVTINGGVRFDGCTVHGNMKINGGVRLRGCTLLGNININGTLRSKNSTFEDALSIAATSISFDASSLKSIEIRKDSKCTDKQVVTLSNKTVVSGDVTFQSGNGEVVIDSSSKVLGSVIGGSISQS